ncbi:MAG: hypothetical protein AAGC86_18420, partial [Pseudomonadota bacterium]
LAAAVAARAGRKETALTGLETERAAARPTRPVSPLTRLGEIASETIARTTRATRTGFDDGARARRDAFEAARDRADAEWRRMSPEARREAERDPLSIHWRPPEQRLNAHAAQQRREPTVAVERPRDERAHNREGERQQPARSIEELFRRDAAKKAREARAPQPTPKQDRGFER